MLPDSDEDGTCLSLDLELETAELNRIREVVLTFAEESVVEIDVLLQPRNGCGVVSLSSVGCIQRPIEGSWVFLEGIKMLQAQLNGPTRLMYSQNQGEQINQPKLVSSMLVRRQFCKGLTQLLLGEHSYVR